MVTGESSSHFRSPQSLEISPIPIIVVVSWFISRHNQRGARRFAWQLGVTLAAMLAALAASGALHGVKPYGTIHLWLGHGLVIVAWLSTPYAIGVTLQQRLS